MSWTAEELAMLKLRAGEGLSAGKIAEYLPGKTRNAVIGMLRRGDGKFGALQGRPKNEARGRRPDPEPKPKLKLRPTRDFVGKTAVDRALASAPSVDILIVSPDCVSYSKPVVPKSFEPVANLPAPLPTAFLDAVIRNRCLHYVGDWFGADGPDMPVCGAERAQGVLETRYCRRHMVVARRVAEAAE